MKSTTKNRIIKYCAVSTLIGSAVATAENTLPQNKPGYDKSKDLGVKAPKGADAPFDGTMKSIVANWEMWPKKEMPITWSIVKSPSDDNKVLMTNGGKKWGTHDLVTKKKYKDFEGHVEFVLMGNRGDDKAEGYANSGVYLQNRHELQIESPKGKNMAAPFDWKIGPHGIGAVCMEHVPKENAWRPNGEWHSFHFIFTAARWEGENLSEPARLTLWWNGLKVHNNVPVKHANGGVKNGPTAEGIKLQENGQDVRFRNIWIKALSNAAPHKVETLSEDLAKEYDLDQSFYAKTTKVQGILIATSKKVPDTTHLEAAYLFDRMMSELKKPIADRIREKNVLCLLVGHDELTSDLPQFKSDKTGKELDFYNWRQRGFLTKVKDRYVVLFAEEDVMEYEGGMQIESILIHEFGHVIHGAGFDEKLKTQWTKTYNTAKAKGLWNDGRAAQRFRRVEGDQPVSLLRALMKAFPDQPAGLLTKCLDGGDILVNGKPTTSTVKVTGKDKVLIVFGGEKECYARKNRAEYFAEGVQCWYNTNRTMDHDHNHIHTREQLKKYDPGLAKLCSDVLGDHEWQFISPRERSGQEHLKDYNPEKSPIVKDLPHIKLAGLDYYDEYWSKYWQRLHDKHSSAEKE